MFSGVSTPKKDTKSAQKNKQGYKVWVASYHMIVAAQEWYIQLQHDKETPSWARFKERCHMRFGHPIQTNPLAELAHFKETESVPGYRERFQALLSHATPFSKCHNRYKFSNPG
jgi:hypothetical protein